MPLFAELHEPASHLVVGHIRGTVVEALQLVEIAAPARLDRFRILQIGLVERLDEWRVRPEEIRVTEEFFHHGGTQFGERGRADRRKAGAGSREAKVRRCMFESLRV